MTLAERLADVEQKLAASVQLHQRALQSAQQAERQAIALDAQAKLLRDLMADETPDGD